MSIKQYIQEEVFGKRLKQARALVVYDPERRYRDVVLTMAGKDLQVIDASTSVIGQREVAMRALQRLGAGELDQLVVWTPAKPPVHATDEDYQQDPFAVLARVGMQFPDGDGDSFHSICRRAKPDHLPEIDRLFANGQVPSFEMVDALDQGGGAWPRLKTLLGVESSKEMLVALLVPKPVQQEALGKDESWLEEAHDFAERILGHRFKTKGKTWKAVADELWRLVLFSEFAFDQKTELPTALQTIACAGTEAQGLVFDVCEVLRNTVDNRDEYIRRALEVESQLALADQTKALTQLGVRDTFDCEERRYMHLLVEAALSGRTDEARAIIAKRQRSIWLTYEGRQTEWNLAERALDLLDAALRVDTRPATDLHAQIMTYAANGKDLDRYQRELEHAYNGWILMADHEGIEALVQKARSAYSTATATVQAHFIRHVEHEGWPATGADLLWNAQLFNKQIAPLLDAGRRVAYILVDSLRYELGVEVEKLVGEKHRPKLHVVCAQLPTYTEVGMASLMPDADKKLRLVKKNNTLTTTLDGEPATDPAGRLAHLKRVKGDRCRDVELDELLRNKKLKVEEPLLVVRTRDIDTLAHQSPHQIHTLIPDLLRQLTHGLTRLAELGFQHAVIATDHGFMLYSERGVGEVAPKPPGNWLVEKSRCVLGQGEADSANLLLPVERLGIPCDAPHYATPRNLVPYQRGTAYFHEGLSLQECVLPCLTIELVPSAATKKSKTRKISISYRQGKVDRIPTRRPVLDISWSSDELFDEEQEMELIVLAVDARDNVVGVAGSGPTFNAATGGIRLRPGHNVSVGLNMNDDFTGHFKVRVLDPATDLSMTADLPLKTAYRE